MLNKMKRNQRFVALALLLCMCTLSWAKDIRTVVLKTVPEMHCANCEKKIKTNIRFVKGVKDIITDLKSKTVTIKYDADKTTVNDIIVGFGEIGYKATVAIPSSAHKATRRVAPMKAASPDALRGERAIRKTASPKMPVENGKAIKAKRAEIK